MARLRDEDGRLKLDSYPRTIEMRVAYADVDSLQRLSATAVSRFFEEGRAATVIELFGVAATVRPDDPLQLSLDSIAIEQLAHGRYPGFVTVATGISALGDRRLGHSAAIFQGPKCLALCEAISLQAGPPSSEAAEVLEKLRYRG